MLLRTSLHMENQTENQDDIIVFQSPNRDQDDDALLTYSVPTFFKKRLLHTYVYLFQALANQTPFPKQSIIQCQNNT